MQPWLAMDEEYQTETVCQNEERRGDVGKKLSPTWELRSAHASTVSSDQGNENEEQDYEYIKFPGMRMRRLPEKPVSTEPALFGSKAGQRRDIGRKPWLIIAALLFVFLVMLAMTLVMACLKCFSECPGAWEKFDEKCYYISLKKLKWAEARKDCQSMDADLMVIGDAKEQKFLSYKMNSTADVWIGLKYIEIEREWRWVDGTANQSFTFWEPSGSTPLENRNMTAVHCGAAKKGEEYWWSRSNCRRRCQFICEKDSQVYCVLQSPLLPF